MKEFKLLLSKEELEKLNEISTKTGITLEELVKIALERFLRNQKENLPVKK